MNVWRNTEARSRNHCCRGKAISITCSECVFVALVIQHSMRMCRIVICGPPDVFPHYLKNGKIFEKTSLSIKCAFLFLYKFLSKTSYSKKNSDRYYHKGACFFRF
jgi:hypothetical protein